MKQISIFFLIIICSSFQSESTAQDIKEKAARIRTKIMSGEQLPRSFEKASFPPGDTGRYSYICHIIRGKNNLRDTIDINIQIRDMDGIYLLFDESHLKDNGREYKSFVYQINQEGIIIWAYRTEGTIRYQGEEGFNDTTYSPVIIEINTAPPADSHDPIKIPDNKTREMYNARLKKTLDELDKVLFKK